MTEVGIFPASLIDRLSGPTVCYGVLGYFNFYSAPAYLWNGIGRLVVGGRTWLGMSDPGATRVVTVSEIGTPEPNVATAIRVSLTGINQEFVTNIYENSRTVEGREAQLYLQVFDGDMVPVGDPVSIDPASYMTSAKYRAVGVGVREVSVTIEGTFSAKNFAPGAQLTDVDQQRRNPGDRVCKFAGMVVEEVWGPNG